MRIYVLRHGIADDSIPDFKRQLTGEGRKKLTAVLEMARRAGAQPELILSSPLVRAVQTAGMAREILRVETPVQETRALTPDASPQGVWEELRGLRNLDSVLLAGHEPLLSSLVAWLLGSPALQVHMTKAALAAIDVEHYRGDPHGILRWMITPKLAE